MMAVQVRNNLTQVAVLEGRTVIVTTGVHGDGIDEPRLVALKESSDDVRRVTLRSSVFSMLSALTGAMLAFITGASLVASMLLSDRKTKPREERDPI